MMGHRLKYILLISIVALCFGCQPDQRPGDWRADVGTDATSDSEPPLSWDGPWERIPSPRGGAAFQKVAGQLLMWSATDQGYEVTHFSTNGEDWKPANESAIASKFEGTGEGSHVEIDGDRYLIVEVYRGEESEWRVFRSDGDADDWQRVQTLAGLSDPQMAYTVNGRVVAMTSDGIHLRQDGSWRELSPSENIGGEALLEVAGPLIIVYSPSSEQFKISSDLGDSWQSPEVPDGISVSYLGIRRMGDEYVVLGAEEPYDGLRDMADNRLLLQSSDGINWQMSKLHSDAPVQNHTLTTLDGELYALDVHSRLVRISADSAQTTVLTDPDAWPEADYGLYRIGSTLVASSSAGNAGSVLYWNPGDTDWSLPHSAPAEPLWIDIRDGRLSATAAERQIYDREDRRWRLAFPGAADPLPTVETADGQVATHKGSDCVYLREANGWQPRLQWTQDGVVQSCDADRDAVRISSIAEYGDGYAIGVREPTDGESLVKWTPESGEIELMAPSGVESGAFPGVGQLLNYRGELWVYSADEPGEQDWSHKTFRVHDGEWRRVDGGNIVGDGPALEEGTEASIGGKEIYAGDLIASIGFDPEGYRDEATTLARWDVNREQFRWIERPEELRSPDYGEDFDIFFREMGPLFASSEGLWRYHVQSGTWDTIGGPFQEDGRPPIFIEVAARSVYVQTVDGKIYVTRAKSQ
jgi:hypothetical protein